MSSVRKLERNKLRKAVGNDNLKSAWKSHQIQKYGSSMKYSTMRFRNETLKFKEVTRGIFRKLGKMFNPTEIY